MISRLALLLFALMLAAPATASEGAWQPIGPATVLSGDTLPAPLLVALAYGFIWLAVLVYLLLLGRRLLRLERELAQIDKALERSAATAKKS